MSRFTTFSISNATEDKHTRLFRPGGPGDRIVFGYMFRIISAVGAVFFAAILTATVIILFGLDFSGLLFGAFCTVIMLMIFVAELLRKQVYEARTGQNEDQVLNERVFVGSDKYDLRLLNRPPPRKTTSAQRDAFSKRFFDIVISASALVFLSPVIVVVSLLIRFDSPGPSMYKEKHLGFRGREIYLRRFRTVRVLEDERIVQIPVGQSYRTRVGALLVYSSLDRLPELWNVLVGDMSIVGPRPISVASLKRGGPKLRGAVRHALTTLHIKPGITGLDKPDSEANYVGASSKTDLDLDIWLRSSIEYANGWSLARDLKILGRNFSRSFAPIFSIGNE